MVANSPRPAGEGPAVKPYQPPGVIPGACGTSGTRQVYFNLREWEEREVEVAKIVVERDFLRKQNEELFEALKEIAEGSMLFGSRRASALLAKHGR